MTSEPKTRYHYELLTHLPEIAGFLSAVLLTYGRETSWDEVIMLKRNFLGEVSWGGGLIHWLISEDYLHADTQKDVGGVWKKFYVTDKALELMGGLNE